jgi:ATP-binding cassette subfamily B multidrug efflux pump
MESFESDIPGKLFDRTLMRRMLHYVRPYAGWMALGMVVVLPLAGLTNLLPLLVRDATDKFLVPGTLDLAGRWGGLLRIATLYLGIGFAAFLLRFGQAYLLSWLGQRILFDLRADIYAKILRLPLGWFDRNPVGRLMTRVGSDVDAMQRLLTDGLVGLTTDLIMLVGVLGFMFVCSPPLALIMLALMPPLLLILLFLNRRVRGAHRAVRQRQSQLNSYLQEMLTGMTTVQLFNRERAAVTRFDGQNGPLRDAFLRSVKWFSLAFPATEIMNVLAVVLVLGYGGWRILAGDPDIKLGTLLAFLIYIRDFFRPLDDLSEKSNVLQAAMASSERVFGLMDTPETIADPPQPRPLTSFRGEVEFDHVWFAYREENWVLRDLHLHIPAGRSVALVGATGAGKSSVTSLIARFYDVQRGTVRVDGVDVRDYAQAELRRRIGVVLQDPFIFPGSLADNISLLNPAVTRERVIESARYVNAHTWIEARPGGYDAVVQERGAGLSTGQKQLLALARAVAQDPDILLILDEATANVDTETERLIQDALARLMKGRTTILIAHRLSTIRHVDQILVLREGQVIERGRHEELIAQDGYYRRLFELLAHTPPA